MTNIIAGHFPGTCRGCQHRSEARAGRELSSCGPAGLRIIHAQVHADTPSRVWVGHPHLRPALATLAADAGMLKGEALRHACLEFRRVSLLLDSGEQVTDGLQHNLWM